MVRRSLFALPDGAELTSDLLKTVEDHPLTSNMLKTLEKGVQKDNIRFWGWKAMSTSIPNANHDGRPTLFICIDP
jgi:hypothetical protein